MKGKIIRAVAGYYYVFGYEDGRTHQCRARGIFRKDGRQPLVGDEVLFDLTHTEDTEGTVDEILPRKNSLIRPPAGAEPVFAGPFSGADGAAENSRCYCIQQG